MLILAGVSLNAIIGDNGIITNAQNANMLSGMASLEEWLQEKYVEYYDEKDNYANKQEVLAGKISGLFLQDGTRNYIINNGKVYYLINKSSLPNEIKNGLNGGNTTEYSKYIRLIDVYGVTDDLKVYYCDSDNGITYGEVKESSIDLAKVKASNINSDTNMQNFLATELAKYGVDVDEELGVTISNTSTIKDLTINGTTSGITSLVGLQDIKNLQTLTLTNMKLSTLAGLEGCPNLYYLYLKNCEIDDYIALSSVLKLQFLYIYLPPAMAEATANVQVTNLGTGLANASGLNKLKYLTITGTTAIIERNSYQYEYTLSTTNIKTSRYFADITEKSKVNDISGLESFNPTIKSNLKYLDLYNNNLSSIESLSDFSALTELSVTGNSNLTNFTGLANHTKLDRLIAHSCGLTSISALSGCTKLTELTLQYNSGLTSLSGLKDAPLKILIANNCNISDISALAKPTKVGDEEVVNNKKDLYYLDLDNNVNLETVSALGDLVGLKQLYLDKNVNMNGAQINSTLADPVTHILTNCGSNYRIPKEYLIYFSTLTSYDYSYATIGEYLTSASPEIIALSGKTNVTRLSLNGQSLLTNDTLNDILKTMTGLEYLNLNGCTLLTNLNFVGVDEIKKKENEETIIVNKVKNLVELDIRATGVSGVELEKLNDYSSSLQNLFVGCTDITPKNILTLINNVSNAGNDILKKSWVSAYPWSARGFVITNTGTSATLDFKDCSLTKFLSYGGDGKGVIFDFSNVSNEFPIYIGWNSESYKFQKNAGDLGVHFQRGMVDFSVTETCSNFEWEGDTRTKIVYPSSPINVANAPIYIRRGNLDWINWSNLVNLNSTVNVKIGNLASDQKSSGLDSLAPFAESGFCKLVIYHTEFKSKTLNIDMTNKTEIDLRKLINVTSLSLQNIPEIPLITSFYLENSEVGTITGLESCTSLTSLTIKDSSISSLSFISTLKQLATINLSGNNITDLSPLLGCITYKNEQDTTGSITFNTLDLSNNNIGAYVTATNSNVDTLIKLYDAGLRTLKLNGNQFSNGQADRLIEKFGNGLTIDYID